LGIGLIFVISKNQSEAALQFLKEQRENPVVVGSVE